MGVEGQRELPVGDVTWLGVDDLCDVDTIKGFLQLLNCFQILTIGLLLFNQITLKGKRFNQFSKPLPLLAYSAFRVSHLLCETNVRAFCLDLG